MSDITAADVAHIANLARLDLTDDEVSVMTEQLGSIQYLIDKVSEVATPDIPPASHPHVMANVLRDDEPGEVLDRADALAGAPDHDGEQFRVPAILGDEQ